MFSQVPSSPASRVLHLCVSSMCSYVQVTDLITAYYSCTSNTLCTAFNTDPWLKYFLPVGGPPSALGDQPCQGIYIKLTARGV